MKCHAKEILFLITVNLAVFIHAGETRKGKRCLDGLACACAY